MEQGSQNMSSNPSVPFVTCILTFPDSLLCGLGRAGLLHYSLRVSHRGAGQNNEKATVGPLSNSVSSH